MKEKGHEVREQPQVPVRSQDDVQAQADEQAQVDTQAQVDESQAVEHWRGKEYSFFTHRKCEAFPCHKGIEPDSFNCLFCYCPLYMLGDRCGGNFSYTVGGIKDCSRCLVPHRRDNYGYIIGRFGELVEEMKRR